MIWFFERDESRLHYEIRRQADGHDYELVITSPDGRQVIEDYADPLELLHRTEELERSLRAEGWRARAPRGRALVGARLEARGQRFEVRG